MLIFSSMKVAEKEVLEEVPSRIENYEILQLVQASEIDSKYYFAVLKSISSSQDKEISNWLNIDERTFRTHKSSSRETKPSLREHAIMIIALFKHGLDVFGEITGFKEWLNKPNFHFDKKAPINFIDTISGIKFIDDRLTGMEYGDNA